MSAEDGADPGCMSGTGQLGRVMRNREGQCTRCGARCQPDGSRLTIASLNPVNWARRVTVHEV